MPAMNVRKGEVPTPAPGFTLRNQRAAASQRIKRLNNVGPVNTLDARPDGENLLKRKALHSSPRVASEKPHTYPRTTSAFFAPALDDDEGAKRSKPNHANHFTIPDDDDVDIESIDDSTSASRDGRDIELRGGKLQTRQDEYRSVVETSPARRRRRKFPGGRRGSVASSGIVSHNAVSLKSASPDELGNSSSAQTRGFSPKRTTKHKPNALFRLYTELDSSPSAPRSRGKPNVVDVISEDELAPDETAVSRRPNRLSAATESTPAAYAALSHTVRCAGSDSSHYAPERGFCLAFANRRSDSWRLETRNGELVNLPWLRIRPDRIMRIQHSGSVGNRVIIHLPRNCSTAEPRPEKICLEFFNPKGSGQFVEALREHFPRITYQGKEADWIEKSSRALLEPKPESSQVDEATIPGTGAPEAVTLKHSELPQQVKQNHHGSPAHTEVTPSSAVGKPATRQRTSMTSLPFKPLSDLVSSRSAARRNTPPSRSIDEGSFPAWSSVNRGWETDWKQSLVYPRTGRDRATVDKGDIQRLDEGEFLNDNLILFYLRYLQMQMETERPELAKKVYFMNTYFFDTLMQKKGSNSSIHYESVKKWTSKVDLFAFDYIVVPVHESMHWFLAIICNPKRLISEESESDVEETGPPSQGADTGGGKLPVEKQIFELDDSPPKTPSRPSADLNAKGTPRGNSSSTHSKGRKGQKKHPRPVRKYDPKDFRIITLDSLGCSRSPTCQRLREYLLAEIRSRKNIEVVHTGQVGMTAKNIPQQPNFCDCGVFLLGYVEHFVKDPDGFVTTLMQKEKPLWDVNPSDLRGQIRETIFRLEKEQRVQLAAEKEQRRAAMLKKRADGEVKGSDSSPACSTMVSRSNTGAQVTPPMGNSPSRGQEKTNAEDTEVSPINGNEYKGTKSPVGSASIARMAGEALLPVDPNPETTHDPRPQDSAGDRKQTILAGAGPSSQQGENSNTEDIRPSVEHDEAEIPETPDSGTLSSPCQEDKVWLSASEPTPPETGKFEQPQLPLDPANPSIQESVEVDEPKFVELLPETPSPERSRGRDGPAVASPRTARSKRVHETIELEPDEGAQQPHPAKKRKQTEISSSHFPPKTVEADSETTFKVYVRMGKKYAGISGQKNKTGTSPDGKGQSRTPRSSKKGDAGNAIDLTS